MAASAIFRSQQAQIAANEGCTERLERSVNEDSQAILEQLHTLRLPQIEYESALLARRSSRHYRDQSVRHHSGGDRRFHNSLVQYRQNLFRRS